MVGFSTSSPTRFSRLSWLPRIASLLLWLAATHGATAQNYSVSDTVTEYPNKGTFYHDKFEGRKTASGEVFDQNKFTAAHWRIKLGTYVLVTNRNTGLQVIVRVNDRCPKRGVFDMSRRAAHAIGIRGMQPVNIRILPEGYEERWAAQEELFDSVHTRLKPSATPTEATDKMPDAVDRNGYNLLLGHVASHSDVYTQTRRLPATYRDRVMVEPLEGSDSLRIVLETKCKKTDAERMARILRGTFPSIRPVVAEQ